MSCDIVLDMSAEELEELVSASALRTTASGARAGTIDVSSCCAVDCAECFVADDSASYMMTLSSTTECLMAESDACGMVEERTGCTGACRMSPGLRLMNDIQHAVYGVKHNLFS